MRHHKATIQYSMERVNGLSEVSQYLIILRERNKLPPEITYSLCENSMGRHKYINVLFGVFNRIRKKNFLVICTAHIDDILSLTKCCHTRFINKK